MGIVVCVTLLLGLLAFLQNWHVEQSSNLKTPPLAGIYRAAPTLLLVMGLWNALWYGLRHLGSFWGNTAIITGFVMLMAGVILLVETAASNNKRPEALSIYQALRPIRLPIFIALLAGFLLYAITLIQLNLGYAIIR